MFTNKFSEISFFVVEGLLDEGLKFKTTTLVKS